MTSIIQFLRRLLANPKIEILGLFLIFISAGWQIFLEEELTSMNSDTEFLRLNNKLDIIWLYTAKYGPKIAGDTINTITAPYEELSKTYQSTQNYTKGIKREVDYFKMIRAFLFLIGSFI